jgi:hypothetical protein
MPKYIVTIRATLDDADAKSTEHYQHLLTEIAFGLAPGAGGSVGSSTETPDSLAARTTQLGSLLRTAIAKHWREQKSSQINIYSAVFMVLQDMGYVPKA